ncbi:ABC transporter ATP-binding protein [Hahella sp. SMD15-11]|uniref:ABC transporter ATP-binding protein n=1 Tax=Thermohahella caldifontis TaxID=3142973 RepID=A0AB39USY9_9GAMM
MISLDSLSLDKGNSRLLHPVTARIPGQRITAVIGPNGSGKSTLLSVLAGLTPPSQGTVNINGTPLNLLPARQRARLVALLPQSAQRPQNMTVEEVVACGRYPWQRWQGWLSAQDKAIISDAMRVCQVSAWRHRRITELSGGEVQRVWLAMALAQDTPVLLLDEPTAWLDLHHQLDLLHRVRSIVRQHKKTVVWVLHDLNQALRYSDHVLLLHQGHLRFAGPPSQLLDSDLAEEVFRVRLIRLTDPQGQPTLDFRLQRTATTTRAEPVCCA